MLAVLPALHEDGMAVTSASSIRSLNSFRPVRKNVERLPHVSILCRVMHFHSVEFISPKAMHISFSLIYPCFVVICISHRQLCFSRPQLSHSSSPLVLRAPSPSTVSVSVFVISLLSAPTPNVTYFHLQDRSLRLFSHRPYFVGYFDQFRRS